MTDALSVFSNVPASVWAAASGALSGVGAWVVGFWKINASIERARMKMVAEAAVSEGAERAAFRESLMSELTGLRAMLKECGEEKEALRERVNSAEGQILVLKASNEIMTRWVTFFKDRTTSEARAGVHSPDLDSIG